MIKTASVDKEILTDAMDRAAGGPWEDQVVACAAALDDLCLTCTETLEEHQRTVELLGDLVVKTLVTYQTFLILHRRAVPSIQ